MEARKSKARHWLQISPDWAFLISGEASPTIINTRHSYIKGWWRFYRVGPGMPGPVLIRLIANELALQRQDSRRQTIGQLCG